MKYHARPCDAYLSCLGARVHPAYTCLRLFIFLNSGNGIAKAVAWRYQQPTWVLCFLWTQQAPPPRTRFNESDVPVQFPIWRVRSWNFYKVANGVRELDNVWIAFGFRGQTCGLVIGIHARRRQQQQLVGRRFQTRSSAIWVTHPTCQKIQKRRRYLVPTLLVTKMSGPTWPTKSVCLYWMKTECAP